MQPGRVLVGDVNRQQARLPGGDVDRCAPGRDLHGQQRKRSSIDSNIVVFKHSSWLVEFTEFPIVNIAFLWWTIGPIIATPQLACPI